MIKKIKRSQLTHIEIENEKATRESKKSFPNVSDLSFRDDISDEHCFNLLIPLKQFTKLFIYDYSVPFSKYI